MKKRTKHIILSIILAVVVFCLFCAGRFGWIVWSIAQSERADWNHFQSLVKTNDHVAVFNAAVSLIRSTTNDVDFQNAELATLPKAISGMKANYLSIYPEGMRIEFHGGFDHYGFSIYKYKSEWKMLWYTEGEQHELLTFQGGTNNVLQNVSAKSEDTLNSR